MAEYRGKIQNVRASLVGTEVLHEHPAGATVLEVMDVIDFDEDGGSFQFYSATPLPPEDPEADPPADLVYPLVTVQYTGIDEDENTITLAEGLPEALSDDSMLYSFPLAQEVMALVTNEDTEDAVWCRVPYNMQRTLRSGVRGVNSMETAIYFEDSDGEYEIREVASSVPYMYVLSASGDEIPLDEVLDELNLVTLPQLQRDLALANQDLETLHTESLPQLNNAITQINTVDLPALNNSINTINTVDLPQLRDDLAAIPDMSGMFPVTETNIADGAISTPKMVVNTILGDRIQANTLQAAKIVAGSIGTDRMTANTINGDRITANTLQAAKIVAGSISTNEMTANTINGDRVTTNTLNAGKIVVGTLSGDMVTANTLNGDRIIGNTLHGDKIIANTISASQLRADAIDGRTITGSTVRTSSGGTRVEISASGNSIEFYSSGSLVGQLLATSSGAFFARDNLGFRLSSSGMQIVGPMSAAFAERWTAGSFAHQGAPPSAGGAANTYIDSEGLICKSTASAAKYKTNIRPTGLDPETLWEWEPVLFDYREDSPWPEVRDRLGTIADLAVGTPFENFVGFDNGEVENYDYGRHAAVVHSILLKDLRRENAELRAQNEDFAARLSALENAA